MSFIDKYKESIQIANYAYNNNSYNCATNRYYYAIFQKILHSLDENNIKVQFNKYNGFNAHVDTIARYCEDILAKNKTGKIKMKEKSKFNTNMDKLKKFRNKADYKEKCVDEHEIKKIIQIFKYLNQNIK